MMRHQSLRPINRIKHVVDFSQTLTAGVNLTLNLVSANDDPVIGQTAQVLTGSTVNAIYLKVEVASNETDAGAIPNCYMFVAKNPGDNLTLPSPNTVGGNDNKKFIIHQEMVMLNNLAGGNPRVLFNGVIVIPRGYRRFGPADKLVLSLRSTAVNITSCVQCHYKEFR